MPTASTTPDVVMEMVLSILTSALVPMAPMIFELATSLLISRPPLDVASGVPELAIALPVARISVVLLKGFLD